MLVYTEHNGDGALYTDLSIDAKSQLKVAIPKVADS